MTIKLFFRALLKFSLGLLLVGLLVFLPAGTLAFFEGWLFMGVLFLPMTLIGILLMVKDPQLLKRRLNAKETEKKQDLVIKFSGLMFLVGFIIAGLDFRFGWLPIPQWVSYGAALLFLIAYALYGEVLRENRYLSRTIEVTKDQKVVDTGLYGIVRHPMYTATLLLFLSIPLVLGSLIALPVFLIYPILMIVRIKNEEDFLERELAGYRAYKQKVKYRLIPFLW